MREKENEKNEYKFSFSNYFPFFPLLTFLILSFSINFAFLIHNIDRNTMLKQILSPAEKTAVKKMLDDAQNVVITCHTSPDGDAIGTSLALWEYLTRKGKNATVIVPNYFPDFLKWMNGADRILLFDRNRALSKNFFNRADLLVAIDYNEPSRLDDEATPFTYSRAKKLMIDHHENPDRFCDLQISRPKLSSSSEVLFRVLDSIGELSNLNKHGAEDIYAGMCTDTGRFSYNSNDPEIFLIIAELMKKGIDKDKIVRNIYNQNTEGRYRLMGYILLEKMQIVSELHAAYYAITKEELQRFKYIKGDMEGVVNMPLEIKGTKVVIALREDTEKEQINVSIRSVDDFPANEMAERFFNGGGHFNAAGGRLYCSLEEAIQITTDAINSYRDKLL